MTPYKQIKYIPFYSIPYVQNHSFKLAHHCYYAIAYLLLSIVSLLSYLCLVHVVLDIQGLLVGRLRARHVLSLGGLRVGLGTSQKLLLGGLEVLGLSGPLLDARRLKSTRERESESPGSLAVNLVDLVQVDGRVLLGNSTRQESHSGHGSGDSPLESLHSHLGNLLGGGLVLGLNSSNSHGGLQQGSLEHNSTVLKLLVHNAQDTLLDGGRGGNVVVSVNQDLGLDNGDKSGLLTDTGVTGKSVGGLIDGVVGRGSVGDVDTEGRAPLGEPSSLCVVLHAPVVQVVESTAPRLTGVSAAQGLEASIDLDSRDDTVLVQELNEGLALGGVLEEGLFEEDGSGDVLSKSGGGEKKLTPLLLLWWLLLLLLVVVGDVDSQRASSCNTVRQRKALSCCVGSRKNRKSRKNNRDTTKKIHDRGREVGEYFAPFENVSSDRRCVNGH